MIDSHEKETLFANVVAENSRWLRMIARQNARGDTWQDLEQDIVLALWRSLDGYEGRSSLATWFYAVAINTAKDSNSSAPPSPPIGTTPSPAPAAA